MTKNKDTPREDDCERMEAKLMQRKEEAKKSKVFYFEMSPDTMELLKKIKDLLERMGRP